MASERDREIWDDATNAVCQAMQEQKMCNCPDGDCLAAKIDFSPEKIATATRPAPAATDTGLETVAQAYVNDDMECEEIAWIRGFYPHQECIQLVTRSQAGAIIAELQAKAKDYREYSERLEKRLESEEATRSQVDELLAAERAEKDGWKELHDAAQVAVKERTEACNNLYKQVNDLKADNAALNARIKELEEYFDKCISNETFFEQDARRVRQIEALEDKLEAKGARIKELEWKAHNATISNKIGEDSAPMLWSEYVEALEAKLAAAEKALEFYADASKWADGYFKSEDDGTVLRAYPSSVDKDQGDKARAALGGKPS
ncbi:hypothetical protein QQF51_12915 [Brucella intermedia]|uniref:hypothetical protein n=1 Tax=Brucella intermedia TaxID=94625 RepID=UPI002554652D|nr:hypothetical protein [Brucella intermedia]MDL2203560.1 hypothetical protein [Brucella intermedia]